MVFISPKVIKLTCANMLFFKNGTLMTQIRRIIADLV